MNNVAPIRRSYARDAAAECGHGTCGAAVDCTGECALKAAVINLPVIDTMTDDRFNLHRPVVDGQTGLIVGRINTKTMEVTDGVAVGACRTDLPIQYADEEGTEPDYFWLKFFGAVLGIAMWLALAFHVFNK